MGTIYTRARSFSTRTLSREAGMDIIKIRFADEFEGLGSRARPTMGWDW